MSVDDARTASVLRRPVVANGQAELVRLSGCLTEQGEIPHFGRPATLHFLLHAGVRHDEMPIVEHVVADEAIEEFLHLCAELWRLQIQLRQGSIEAVADRDVAAVQLPLQFDVVIPRHAQRRSRQRHRHHRFQRIHDARTAVDEIADEYRLAA